MVLRQREVINLGFDGVAEMADHGKGRSRKRGSSGPGWKWQIMEEILREIFTTLAGGGSAICDVLFMGYKICKVFVTRGRG